MSDEQDKNAEELINAIKTAARRVADGYTRDAVNIAGRAIGRTVAEAGEMLQDPRAAPLRDLWHAINLASNGEAERGALSAAERLRDALARAKGNSR
jgi:hypothetical protein